MARIRITEYAAKKLILGDTYTGVSLTQENLAPAINDLSDSVRFVLKIDTGLKKRGLAGLVKVNLPKAELIQTAQAFFDQGYARCILEEMHPHKETEEQYLSIEIGRKGTTILYAPQGGMQVENNATSLQTFLVAPRTLIPHQLQSGMPPVHVSQILTSMERYHISFLEINPFIIKEDTWIALDMAAECDSAKVALLPEWIQEHVITPTLTPEEQEVLMQNERSQASLNLRLLNPKGSILTLLSGGGASLVTMDTLVEAGLQSEIINYSEYSGAPTRDETSAYVTTLLLVLFASPAPKKVIVIAGGVSNFTDIKETFLGIIDACTKCIPQLQAPGVTVCVRRGGLNQEVALKVLRDFFAQHSIQAEVHGPEIPLCDIGSLVKKTLL